MKVFHQPVAAHLPQHVRDVLLAPSDIDFNTCSDHGHVKQANLASRNPQQQNTTKDDSMGDDISAKRRRIRRGRRGKKNKQKHAPLGKPTNRGEPEADVDKLSSHLTETLQCV